MVKLFEILIFLLGLVLEFVVWFIVTVFKYVIIIVMAVIAVAFMNS